MWSLQRSDFALCPGSCCKRWKQHQAVTDPLRGGEKNLAVAGLVRFWHAWQLFKKKVLVKESYRCIYLRGMHVVYYLWLYTGNYLSRELGSAPGTSERKMQPQCLQQSSQSLQEEWAQQENPPTTSSTWICLWLDFGRKSLSWDWLNFNSVSECCDCKQLHWLQQYPASLWVVALEKANCQKGWQREERLTSPAPAHWDLSLPCSGNNLHRNGPTAGTLQSPEHLSHSRHSALTMRSANFHFICFTFLL